VIVQGTLPVFCYADGMTAYLSKRRIRISTSPSLPSHWTDAIKAMRRSWPPQRLKDRLRAQEEISARKTRVKGRAEESVNTFRMVLIFSALEPCTTYQPWHDKQSGRTYHTVRDANACILFYFVE